MSTTVNKYRIWCQTENQYVYTYGVNVPVACPNNTSDIIDTSSIANVETITSDVKYVKELLSGSFQASTVCIDVPAGNVGDIAVKDISWPVDVTVRKTQFKPLAENVGDEINIVVAPNFPMGTLTQVSNIGDTVLNVTGSVFNEYVKRGMEVALVAGSTVEKVGRLINLDSDGSTIQVENALTQSFPSGSVVTMGTCMVKDYFIHSSDFEVKFGDKGFGEKFLPANVITRMYYKNNSTSAKKLYISVEVHYN